MSKKTIANFCHFVILSSSVLTFFSGCSSPSSRNSTAASSSSFGSAKTTGTIADGEITESSGIAASKCQPNVYWTHNDSGDDAFIFAFDKTGAKLGTWKVTNAENVDWEDIALHKDSAGKCFIYIGEIGDNESKRDERVIYRVAEPKAGLENASATKQQPLTSEPAETIRFTYPDRKHNAETLLVHPDSGDIYVVTKTVSGPATVFRIKPVFGKETSITAEKVSNLSVPSIPNGFLTGGDISPDGKRVVICDYSGAYEFTLPMDSKNFDDIWSQTPVIIDVGKRKTGEAVTYSPDGNSIILTSEGRNSPILEVLRKK